MVTNPDAFDTSASKLALAKQQVHLVWGSGKISETLDIEYEGVAWEVIVRVKQTEDARLPPGSEADFIEELPE
jgi:hypothetical protein